MKGRRKLLWRVDLPWGGQCGGFLVPLRSCILVCVLVSWLQTGCLVSADWGLVFVLPTSLWQIRHLRLLSQVASLFYSSQMSLALIRLEDICQRHAGLPPTGRKIQEDLFPKVHRQNLWNVALNISPSTTAGQVQHLELKELELFNKAPRHQLWHHGPCERVIYNMQQLS